MRILLALLLPFIAGQGLATALRGHIQSLVGKKLSSSLAIIAKINETDEHGRNALHYAAELGDLPLVEFITGNSANLHHATDNDGNLPLDYAIKQAEESYTREQMLIVSHILEKTRGVKGRDEKGWPPINWAILAGDLQRVKELVGKGINLSYLVLCHRSNTLGLAYLVKDQEIIDYLLSIPTILDKFISLGRYKYAEINKALEMGFDVNTTDEHGQTLLHKAVKYRSGSKEIVDLLLQYNANPNAIDDKGRTPMHIISSQPRAVYKSLLAAGADVAIIDNNGQTPMHTADWGHREIGEMLQEAGADINAVDNNGQTPLHIVNHRSDMRSEFLLKAGANPNAVDNNGQTPLHAAFGWVYGAGKVKKMLEYGADSNITDNKGLTPLQVITRNFVGKKEIMTKLNPY